MVIGRGQDRVAQLREIDAEETLRVDVPDHHMSGSHARLDRAARQWVISDLDSKNGCIVNGERVSRQTLTDGDVVELGHTFFMFRNAAAAEEDDDLVARAGHTHVPALLEIYDQLDRVATTTTTIILQGESGTGKEVLARRIHDQSGRAGKFVAVNCGALPDGLVESELFGHEQGAFSGATAARLGHVRASNGGTLMLDEIGDLPAASQAALLRVLEQKEVVPVGDSDPLSVDLRVIAATHRDLDSLVADGDFRADLLARLADFRVQLPPLRERAEDIGILLESFIPEAGTLTRDAARALLSHDWPMNVRELKKCMQTSFALAGGEPVAIEHLPQTVREAPAERARTSPATEDDATLRARIVELLGQYNGNVSAVARALDKARPQVHRLLKRFAIDPNKYRG